MENVGKWRILLMAICLNFASSIYGSDMKEIDSVLVRELGSSLTAQIFSADSILAEVIPWEGDSLASKSLPEWMMTFVRYTLCQPYMYASDKRVYCDFVPDAYLKFSSGEVVLTLELDYNIFKWRLVDATGKVIIRRDMSNRDFLPMLYMLFPESELMKIKYNYYLKSYEKK